MKGFYGLERRRAGSLELAIAGAGAAGLSAAIYASLLDLNYVLFDAEAGGGLMNLAKRVENMPGAPGMRGPEIVKGLLSQLESVGGRLRSREPVTAIERGENGQPLHVRTFRSEYRPKCLIIATGLQLLGVEQEFGIEGERRFIGKGLSYCAECDGPLFQGKRVMVVGSPFDAFLLKRLSKEVFYLGPMPEEFRSQVPSEIIEANDIRYLEGTIDGLVGEESLEGVIVDGRPVALDGLFLTKRSSGTELYERLGVALDGEGFVRADRHGATNLACVFAAGDITGEPWQIAKSIGEGAVAALSVFKFLTGQEIRNLGWALGEEWER